MGRDTMGNGRLTAGMAAVDITPQTDICLAGEVGWFRPGRYVSDRLYARAVVFTNATQTLCLVGLDLTIVTEEWAGRIRQAAAERLGTTPDAVMVHATQVHAAPALGAFMADRDFRGIPDDMAWLNGGDPRYFEFAYARIIEAIELAAKHIQPVRIRVGSGIEGRIQFNRRAINHEGKAQMPGPHWPGGVGPSYIRYLEGPIDPEVGVMCVQGDGPEVRGLLLHYTGHPVNVFPQPVVSADWPGAWGAAMQQRLGSQCVPLVLNGCCGNINPWDPFDPDYVADHRRMGRLLADMTEKVLETLDVEEDTTLAVGTRSVAIPLREVEPDMLAWAEAFLDEHPEPLWSEGGGYAAYERSSASATPARTVHPDWMKAVSIVSAELQRARDSHLAYEIQAFRVGRTAFVGLPGEPFVEGQLQIKIASPTFPTNVAHCCNMYGGYIPIPEAFGRGGHEVETRYWSKLVPEALPTIVANTTSLLRELFN